MSGDYYWGLMQLIQEISGDYYWGLMVINTGDEWWLLLGINGE